MSLPPSHPLLLRWQTLSRAGLNAANEHSAALAESLHAQAAALSHVLLGLPEGEIADDDRCAAFVVAHLNWSDSHQARGHVRQAHQVLLEARAALQSWLAAPERSGAAMLVACRHMRQLLAALLLLTDSSTRQDNPSGPLAARPVHPPGAIGPVQGGASPMTKRQLH